MASDGQQSVPHPGGNQMNGAVNNGNPTAVELTSKTPTNGAKNSKTVANPGTPIPTVQGRLQSLLKSIDPSAELSSEVEETLISLVTEFVRATTREASKLAVHRTPKDETPHLEVQDLKFVVKKLGIHVPGYDSLGTKRNLVRKPAEVHEDRIALKKRKLEGNDEEFDA